ncbi:MAG: ABC transporter permease [Candidatus Limnocylindrales bacterium]
MRLSSNIRTIARREYIVRVRTRTFAWGSALLMIGVVIIALLPVIVRQVDRVDATRIAVAAPTPELGSRMVASLTGILNAGNTTGEPAAAESLDFTVTSVADVTAGRDAIIAGHLTALLGVERDASGELAFTLYTNENAAGRTASLVRQAANTIAIADRLDRLGIQAGDQATLFSPAPFQVTWPDPARTEPVPDTLAMVGQDLLAFGMTILIFMIIVMYGNWIAMSVVEEKSSRVMEVVLNAATPFQLLTGKVFGVGAVAITQYGAVVLSGGLALLLQDPIANVVLGEQGTAVALPEGLTPGLLLLFGVYGVLGFLLYASLYAAAGSLVSRQEDVTAAVMPMTLVSTAGYIVGVYAAMGLLDIRAGWIVALTQVPFLSPFMMLGRIATGAAQPWEILLSVALLVVSIGIALWLASRIYAAGVLLYGQRPGARALWHLVRVGM